MWRVINTTLGAAAVRGCEGTAGWQRGSAEGELRVRGCARSRPRSRALSPAVSRATSPSSSPSPPAGAAPGPLP